jgi:hypothetical protein
MAGQQMAPPPTYYLLLHHQTVARVWPLELEQLRPCACPIGVVLQVSWSCSPAVCARFWRLSQSSQHVISLPLLLAPPYVLQPAVV